MALPLRATGNECVSFIDPDESVVTPKACRHHKNEDEPAPTAQPSSTGQPMDATGINPKSPGMTPPLPAAVPCKTPDVPGKIARPGELPPEHPPVRWAIRLALRHRVS